MPRAISWKKGLSSILFWSIISAAFIGPGTVTTAARSGAEYGLDLLWALFFSTLATILLQEAAARLTVASGKNLGEVVALKYPGSGGRKVQWLLFLTVAFGCAAYQAGNLLGAVAGMQLLSDIPSWIFLLGIGLLAALLLWIGKVQQIAKLLGVIVALMGAAFIYVALQSDHSFPEIAGAALSPTFPAGSTLLITGLIGTTIVPYNLFLASGIGRHQDIREMRLGIILAVLIGGVISMAILIVGAQMEGVFSFAGLASALSEKTGPWAARLFSFGLLVAGFTSAVTAPLAAAVTAGSLLDRDRGNWAPDSRNFRLVWATVLGIGLFFGLTKVQPIPAIILAQAINGALLPIVAVFLFLAVNDRQLLGSTFTNGLPANIGMLFIVGLTSYLGLHHLLAAWSKAVPALAISSGATLWVKFAGTALILAWLGGKVLSGRPTRGDRRDGR